MATLTGVTLTGTASNGEPSIRFSHPKKVGSLSVATLRKGTGKTARTGQRLCFMSASYNARTGKKIASTWSNNTKDCSVTLDSQVQPAMRSVFTGAKTGTIWAFGLPGSSSGSTASTVNDDDAYISVMELTGTITDPTHATGTPVTNIPSNLPKVTRAANGKPSIDINGYKAGKKLVTQTLLQGDGATVGADSTVKVQYTGWLLNGKQFDSSWKSGADGSPIQFSLNQVITGWKQGLAGQKVGSQVLLIVPPSLGYGNKATGSIPANSTLVFVVDILAVI